MNQNVWIGITIGVFFVGLGVGYAALQSTVPATPMMNQQQMQQMMNDPNMMNQWHQTMMQNPQAMNQWMGIMINDQQFMQQMHNSMMNDAKHMQTMAGMMGPDMMGYMMNNTQMNQQLMRTMMENQQYMHGIMMDPQFQQNWMGPWMSNSTNWNHMMDSGWMSQEMLGNHMMGSDMMMGSGMMGTQISNQSLKATNGELEKYKMANKIASQHLETFDELDFDVFTNQNWERLHESHSQDIVVHWPDGRTTQGIKPHIEDLKAMFVYAPDTRIEQHPIKIASGNWTSVVGVIEGTFTEPMPLPDGSFIPPTGKSFKLTMATVGYWENGVMTEEYLFWDNLEFMKQIGLA